MSDPQELYAYTTAAYSKRGYLKVGQCRKGRHKERISEQFGTSNPETPIIKLVLDLPEGMTDHHIHQKLIDHGIEKVEDSTGREWFKATLDQVQRAYNSLCFGSERTHSYDLRKEQKAAVDKALKWFKGDYPHEVLDGAAHPDRFLLNAKMRFGKCFTGIHIAKQTSSFKTLIVTYKPEVISEWMGTVSDHVHFEGWTGIRARRHVANLNDSTIDDEGNIPSTQGPIVVCVSLQDLSINADGSTKTRLQNIVKTDWDLIIFDEVHFGSRTERAKYIIDSLKWSKRLDLSGTPFRLIQEEDFCAEQVFTYSYLDEQANKKEELSSTENLRQSVYKMMPYLDVSTIEITDEDIQDQAVRFYTDDLDFSLNELFRTKGSSFVHNDAVEHFIDGLCKRTHDARAISVFGKLGDNLGVPSKRHSVWWLNRVEAVRLLAKRLKNHPYFSNFEIISAAGQEGPDADNEEKIVRDKKEIERKLKKSVRDTKSYGSITLTVRRFLTGVTIKEWDSILVLNDVSSPESYYQAIFRVQSAWTSDTGEILKPKSWVFDFAISRCLRLTFHYADALADQLDQQDSANQILNDNIQKVTDGLCDTLDIKRFFEGDLVSNPTTSNDIFEAINFTGSRLSLAKRITSDALVSFVSLKHLEEHPDLLEALKRVKGYRTQEVGDVEDFLKIGKEADELSKHKGEVDKDEEEIEKENEDFVENEKDKDKKSRKKWFATQIKRLAICMADFIYMTQFREHKIDHVIETRDSDFFNDVTGISKDEFRMLCELGFINHQALNRIVREFRCQEESSLVPEEYILNYIKKVS